MLALYVVLYYN